MVQSDYSVSSLSLLEIKKERREKREIELDNIFDVIESVKFNCFQFLSNISGALHTENKP